jgi:predicted ATP-grasp superfamily ATP-dependent carboligase
MDLVRPLGRAGIRSTVVVEPGDVAAYSRFTRDAIPRADPTREPDMLQDRLMAYARTQPEPPILYYGQDSELLFVSRRRDRLQEAFRFAIAERELVEDLADKARFRELAHRLELPVPRAAYVEPAASSFSDVELRFPLIVKPAAHGHGDWSAIAAGAKAVRVDDAKTLRGLWPRLAQAGLELVLQELIAGPETRIESYHVYVDPAGDRAGEFTGRKLRTHPADYGETTALEITDAGDVAELGREVTRRLGLHGVAKLDFKRDEQDRLHLLEVNARFNLWHHAGAVAGVNLPALVFADQAGLPRPRTQPARAGVRWIYHEHDARAARRQGVPLRRWLPWALASEAKAIVALDDPLPMVMGGLNRIGQAVGIGPRGRRR